MENGNGELRQLLEIKRTYRRNLTSLEEELKAKFDGELAEGKKHLQSLYLENIVDVVFAEGTSAPPVEEPASAPQPALPPAPVESKPVCPECESPIGPTDKFCPNCAFPLAEKEDEKPVGIASSRKLGTRVRR